LLGSPTLNLDLSDISKELDDGVYAVRVVVDDEKFRGVMHYGERPTLGLGRSCEVHILEKNQQSPKPNHQTNPKSQIPNPKSLIVTVAKKLRDVREFADEEELKRQIAEDIHCAKNILLRP
jgi:riboflavin kinase / FMN adenylyltransferase